MLCVFLKGKNPSGRAALLFTLGINSGLRISDLLKLRVVDVKNRERITIVEQKTKKSKDFPLSDTTKKMIKDYLAGNGLGASDYLFPSRKGHGPLQRIQAWKILSAAARAVGIKENIGTHTLRKSFGYHAYQQGIDISRIMQLLNHSSQSYSLRYIGITKEELDDVYLNLNL